jgi:hypothetical protein
MSSQTEELDLSEKVQTILDLAPKLNLENRMKVLTLIHILNSSLITEQADGSRVNLDKLDKIHINRIYNMIIRYSGEEM